MFNSTLHTFAVLLLLLPTVLAASKAYVELVNGTPYDWHLISNETHHMRWFPNTTIPSGTSAESCISWILYLRDAKAEATYRIDNPSSPESFTVRARRNPTKIEVVYHENLSSLNNPKNSIIDLVYSKNHPHPFILAGNGISTPYVSSNPPIPWMQSTISTLSSRPLRQISMPMAHNAGANIVSDSLKGPGTLHNTQTQFNSVFMQLIFGARWLDIRPVFYEGKWMTYHSTFASGKMWGATGQSIESVIEDVNRFTKAHPGELIVLDISHDASNAWKWRKWRKFDAIDWMKLFELLSGIRNAWQEPRRLGWDLSLLPFDTFVTKGGNSTVLVRIPCDAQIPVSMLPGRGKRDTNTTLAASSAGCDSVSFDDYLAPLNTTGSLESQELSSSPIDKRKISKIPGGILPDPLSRRTDYKMTFTPLPATRLPVTGHNSATDSPSHLASSQLHLLSLHKSSPAITPQTPHKCINHPGFSFNRLRSRLMSVIGGVLYLGTRYWRSGACLGILEDLYREEGNQESRI
ncbi:putative plc-like phosphodiesterase protein [Botrytis fragariae]|uniref:Putative plc-like phosphodiesterase protein n=1 Tax=Botrytis fragariae TaxID=1964551 RepID=A0A8H6EF00_9HELO|nr:putative plc-like phosphodiesterase protein [Botrytis fragariae]KAF5869807.1 putative plc-like phosphodiesterase protein [Botrytis fragariae]